MMNILFIILTFDYTFNIVLVVVLYFSDFLPLHINQCDIRIDKKVSVCSLYRLSTNTCYMSVSRANITENALETINFREKCFWNYNRRLDAIAKHY